MSVEELKSFLNEKYEQYNHSNFIETDPICIPHQFSKKEDIEIIAFIVATIAWGNRKSIIKNGKKLVEIMEHEPYVFIKNYEGSELDFVHRTFNSIDLDFFFRSLKNIYLHENGLEGAFGSGKDVKSRILRFREIFLMTTHQKRSEKHLSNPLTGSACKRINMFLRWMVRKDAKGVDFGLWNDISPAELMIPLDVHTGNVARSLGLIERKSNDWKALEELMNNMRKLDPNDPAKYDFALFGLGAFEDFENL